MSIYEALRTTAKGRLVYKKKIKDELSQVSPPPLSRYHVEKGPKPNHSFELTDGNSLSNEAEAEKDEIATVENHFYSDKQCSSPDSLVRRQSVGHSYRFIDTSPSVFSSDQCFKSPGVEERFLPTVSANMVDSIEAILRAEKLYESRLQRSLLERCKKYEEHNRTLSDLMKNKYQDAQRKFEHLKDKRKSSIERKHQAENAMAYKNLQSLRASHERHKQKMDTKQKEIEQARLHLERELKKKEDEQEQRHQLLKSLMSQVEENHTKFLQMYERFEPNFFPELIARLQAEMEKTNTHLSLKSQEALQTGNIPDELISDFQSSAEESQKSFNLINKQVAEIKKQLKEAAEKKKQEEAKHAEVHKEAENVKKQEATAAEECGVQALRFALKERIAKGDLLLKVETSIKGFVDNSDSQMKQYRFDLQRAVNTPINAISGVDSHHLRDKLHRLLALLRGQEVKVSNRSVRADRTPEALLFCQNLIAKMLVRKGEEQVSSLHESAFPISAVLLGLWCEFPIVGNLFMAHLQSVCPYILPHYHTHVEGETSVGYHRSLGYKVDEDGAVEEQDKFLRRMSGLMRLYCACLITSPPPPTPGGATRPPHGQTQFTHPQGLENAWMWLARVMDQDPHPDITAGLIYDVLVTCGAQMMRQYSIQFVKLVFLLYKQYVPKLKDVAVTNATLGRLEIFLEGVLKSGRIAEPEGALPTDFWCH